MSRALTVGELITALSRLDPELEVFIYEGAVTKVSKKKARDGYEFVRLTTTHDYVPS
jgi:hypothetical protein